jgi:YfiH family protein
MDEPPLRPLGRRLDQPLRESVLLHADWPAPGQVRALTTLRHGPEAGLSRPPFDAFNLGQHCGDAAEAVAHNRAALRQIAALPAEPRWLRQVHGARVVRIVRGDAAQDIEADAAVTRCAGEVLVVLTADCLPLLLCSRRGEEVAAVHAGWRGLAAGIVEQALGAMHTPPDQLLAWIGPCAGAQRYEVGQEVREAFLAVHAEDAEAFRPSRPGHWLCDLPQLARARLARMGVSDVHGKPRCTLSDAQRFYSHRRDGRCGRMATLIWIDPLPC